MKELNKLWDEGFLYGGDYNPEQWLWRPETFEEDIDFMKTAKINVVSLGMFSWSSLEPEEGVYNFQYLEDVINRLYENGISSFLSTPSGARPAWMAHKYPEVLRTDANGIKQQFGERHNHCFTSPVYREKVNLINSALAEYFKDNPAVKLWHVSNEYEGECHCDLCQVAFREWLKVQYDNSLEKLNFAWWTSFWGHRFTDWDQIDSPKERGDWSLDGKNLDWRKFVTAQTVDFFSAEVKPLNEITPNIPITTNFHDFTNIATGLNYWEFARSNDLDIISWDNYPYWHNETHSDGVEAARRAFMHNINRSLLNKPFLLLESCPGPTNWQRVNRLPKPGVVALQGVQAVAHGADSVQYFQIRQSLGASEKFHAAVIGHDSNKETRLFKEVKSLGEDLEKIDEVIGSMPDVRVAIIYDWEQKWAVDAVQGLNEKRRKYLEFCIQHYYPLWRRGINVDVIDMKSDVDKYDLVIAPMLYMLPEDLAEKLNTFVKEGGNLVTGPFSGVVDGNQHAYTNGRPGPLREATGIWVEESDALYDSQFNSISGFTADKYKVKYFCDLLHLESAEAMLSYEEDFYKGMPALTKNEFGEGTAYYFATIGAESELYDDFYNNLLNELMPDDVYDLPYDMAVATRETEKYVYVFYTNFSANEYVVKLKDTAVDMLRGQELTVNSKVVFPAYTYKILRVSK